MNNDDESKLVLQSTDGRIRNLWHGKLQRN